MVDTYTQALKARKIEQGGYDPAWATRLNADVVDIFDAGISGQVTIDIGSNTSYSLAAMQSGTLSASHYWRLNIVGTPASAVTFTIPVSVTPSKEYLIDNQTGQALTVKYAATAGITVQDGDVIRVLCDGTTVIESPSAPRFKVTTAEIAAGVTPVNLTHPFGHVYRYGTNTIPGTTDMTVAIQTALDLKYCILPAETMLATANLTIDTTGTVIRGESKALSKIKFSSAVTKGLTTPYWARADGAAITYVTDLTLENFCVDITDMPDADGTCGILIEDSYANKISNIRIIDPLDEASDRWGLRIGRAVYTTSVSDCTIGRRDLKGSTTIANFNTTIRFFNCDSWFQRARYAFDILMVGDTIQKDVDKYDVDFCAQWTIIGGDYEGGCFFIRTTTAGSVSDFYSMGNAFGGLVGSKFGGAGGRPLSSLFLDETSPEGSRSLTSLTRSGTTATGVVITTLAVDGTFAKHAPVVGQYITIAGAVEANFNGQFGPVLTSTPGTNTFTFAIANSGATTATGSPTVQPDSTVGGRYVRQYAGAMAFDSVAPRTILKNRWVLQNNTELAGFLANGTTELRMIYVDTSGNIRFGDGTTVDVLLESGHIRNTVIGKGLVLRSPDGTVYTATIANGGTWAIV